MSAFRALYANRSVRVALTLALVAVVVARIDAPRVARAAATANPGLLVLALALTVPFLTLKAARWYLMLRAADVEATPGEATLSLIGGMGLALVTPARMGEVVRGAYLRDAPKLKVAGLVLLDKGFDVLVLCLMSVAGAWRLLGPIPAFALALVGLGALAATFVPDRVQSWLLLVPYPARLRGPVTRLLSGLTALRPGPTAIFLLLTALSFVVVLIQFGLILLSWRAWSLDIVALTFPLVILTNVLPITVGGLGVREGAAALLLSHYGVSPAHAAVAAFLMFAMNTALPGLAGALLLPAPAAAGPRAAAPR